MKTTTWVLTTLALFIIVIGFAAETPKMNIAVNDADKILVSFESATACPVELIITGNDGEVLRRWQTETPKNSYNQLISRSELGNGTYNVALNYGGKSINRELRIENNEIKVGPSIQLLEPFFCFKNDRLKVSFLNAANKNVYLNVYKNGEHYTGFKLGKDMDIQKCIDFSMAEKGKYEIVLSDYFKEHYYAVNK
jgi:hypothetical protein